MNVRERLEDHHKYDFRLVGSRALGTAKPDSDWDYVVTVTEGVLGELLSMGFANVMGADVRVDDKIVYGDNDRYVKAIVQRRCDETDAMIQVAIVADASLKLRIMEVLGKHKILRDFDLSLHRTKARNELWDALYALTGWTGSPGGTGGAQYDHKQEPKKNEVLIDLPIDEDIPF